MKKLFGNFIEHLPKQEEYLTIGFSPSSLPLKERWENNGLSADFIADYFKNFYINKHKKNTEEDEFLIDNFRTTVKYIANELLENAMKFQDLSVPFTAKIQFSLYTDKLIFCVTNGVTTQQAENFGSFIQQVNETDPEELYMNAMRANALKEAQGEESQSGLGLLSMICDYAAELAWKFEDVELDDGSTVTTVTTMVSLDTNN